MASPPAILVITGPTASGKTDIGISCARALDAEIVSADSRQVYRDFDIGTAKPSREQLAEIRHHFIGEIDPRDGYSAGRFAQDSVRRIAEILGRGKRVLVVGGSGLYVQALIDGIFQEPDIPAETRLGVRREYRLAGLAPLVEELRRRDPEYADIVDVRNAHRILRAIEVCRATGKPFSEQRRVRATVIPYTFHQVCLGWPRNLLYRRIDDRVLEMIRNGLFEEVESLLDRYGNEGILAMNSVGYREAVLFLRGGAGFDETVTRIQQHTRNFAKRQLTWFRKDQRLTWYDPGTGEHLEALARRIAGNFLSAGTR